MRKFSGVDKLLLILAIIAYLFAVVIYHCIYELELFQSLFYGVGIFLGDIKAPAEIGIDLTKIEGSWKFIYISGLFAVVISFFTIIKIYLKKLFFEQKLSSFLNSDKHIIVIGLNENSKIYIDSELKIGNKKIIIIEKDDNNFLINHYEKNIIPTIIGDATDLEFLQSLNLEKAKHIVISAGNDMVNLEIATQIIFLQENIEKKPLYVHIEDRNLRHFHKENGIFKDSSINIFSYYEDASRALFEEYDIDGDDTQIITSNDSFSIVVVGNTSLTYEVIYQACMIGQLPNENKLTIYCIDKNVIEFQQSVELNFTEIEKISNIELKYVALDINSKEFYKHELWQDNITNVILCFENDQKNLDIAANIANITYLDKIAEDKLKTKILIAMFNAYSLSESLKKNSHTFKNFFTFGQRIDINDREYLINEQRDKIAKATNFVYETVEPTAKDKSENYEFEYAPREKSTVFNAEERWQKLSYFKKESNRAVADHIKTKLKYLGLKHKVSDEKDTLKLLNMNESIFYSRLKDEYVLAKNEHNRWNAFHFLNGYRQIDFLPEYEKNANKKLHELQKVHMCLVKDYSDFKKSSNQLEDLGYSKWQFEGYDYLINNKIPYILAESGYELTCL